MQLVHFGIEIEFPEGSQLHTPAHRVFHAFGAKLKGGAPREPGARVRVHDLRAMIVWHYDRCEIEIEKTEKQDACIASAMRYLEIINSVAPMSQVANRHVVTNWILPAPKHTFSSLEQLYKQKMMTDVKLMQGTYDSSIVLDIKIDDCILHHQSGPMELKQLCNDFLEFERRDLPEVFIFLYASLRDTKVIEYSKQEMQGYLEKAFHHCVVHS